MEELPRPEGGYQVVLLADVIEHLDDPLAALDACTRLLAPGGALCVVTPDAGSRTARLAGPRWWGYIPAHTFLFPRGTLRELLEARGLVLAEDQPLRRSFELRYWMGGLAERGGRATALAGALARTPLGHRRVTMSLGDERVMLAHKVPVARAQRPLMRDRGGDFKVHVVLPAYRAAETIPEVARSMPVESADRALLVDDASPDDTSDVALREGLDVLRRPTNRGYGANQKTCYVQAILDGADAVVMVHADNQYDPALVAQMVKPIAYDIADVVIGSRLLEDEAIAGGMPRWKWVGNRFLTTIENLAFRRGYSEYHTGYRAFSTEFLRSIAFLRNDDGFVFDQEIFAQMVARRARVLELPIPTRYFREASTVSFRASVEYGLRTLGVLARYRLDERRGAGRCCGRRRRAFRRARASAARTRLPRGELARPRGRRLRRPQGRLEHRGAGAGQGRRARHRRGVGRDHHALPRRVGLRPVRAGPRLRADARAAGRPRAADGGRARDQPRPGGDGAAGRAHAHVATRPVASW